MTTDDLYERVERRLKRLGSRSAKVAGRLRGVGVSGTRGCINCPVARWLELEFPRDAFIVSVGLNEAGYDAFVLDFGDTGDYASVPLPPAVAEFARDFDSGKHPYLEAA